MITKTTNVFTRNLNAYLNKKIRRAINQGGTSCFSGDQGVISKRGSIPISKIKIGDIVKTFNETTGANEWKKVNNVFQYKNTKPTVRIKMKNGKTITVTDDHEFYFEGGWHSIKHILYLKHGRNLEAYQKI